MVCSDGMGPMSYRTTFALDRGTVERLKRLSVVWHISQAGVVRRAIALADEAASSDADPAGMLRTLHESGDLLVREQAEKYLGQVSEGRQFWRDDG